MAASPRRPVGTVGSSQISVVETDQAWTLDVDAIVISVGPDGLGRLGQTLQRHLTGVDWRRLKESPPTPDRPLVLAVDPSAPESSIKHVVCVATRPPSTSAEDRQTPARKYIGSTVIQGVFAADQAHCRRLAISLLGAGSIGLDPLEAAELMVPAALDAVARTTIQEVTFVAHGDGQAQALVQVAAGYRNLVAMPVEPEPDPDPEPEPPAGQLTSSAWQILRDAVGIAGERNAGPAEVLLAALRKGATGTYVDVPRSLLLRLAGPDGSDTLLLRLEGAVGVHGSSFTGPDEQVIARAEPLFREALELPGRLGYEPLVHARHVIAAAVSRDVGLRVLSVLGVSPVELRSAFLEALMAALPSEPKHKWEQVLATEPAYSNELAGGMSEDLVDPELGISSDRDHLKVSGYVDMLASAIARRDTPLPLSIGLFGEWGSGKSYFMGLMRGRIKQLSASEGDTYWRNVVQIGFNAWSYADSNLWASLGDEIFNQLAGPKALDEARDEANTRSEREQVRHRIEQLEQKLSTELVRTRELETAKANAEKETGRLRAEQQKAEEASRQSLTALRLLTSARRNQPLTDEFNRTLRELGIDGEVQQARALAGTIQGVPADVKVVRAALNSRSVALSAVVLFGLLLAAGVVAASFEAPARWLGTLGLTGVATGLAGATATARRIHRALQRLPEIVQQADPEDLKQKMAALHEAEEQRGSVQSQLDQSLQRTGEIERELAQLTPGGQFYSFLAERAGSGEYRQQLGLISTIRRDFGKLARLMKDWPESELADRPIDRIVLYIDDLDRCSPERVVEVLQAVHLLLALDLFVVVVGVDPRWMLHSLRLQYRQTLSADDEEDDERDEVRADQAESAWRSTPQDYLEKIFNIPFVLPGMDARGFDTLIRQLSAVKAAAPRAATPVPAPGPLGTSTSEAPRTVVQPVVVPKPVVEAGSELAAIQEGHVLAPRPLMPKELDILSSLAPLVRSPRETKRLLNVYRMIRSAGNLSDSSGFLSPDDEPGDFQAVAVMLGLLTASPRLLGQILSAAPGDSSIGGLYSRPGTGQKWRDVVVGLTPREVPGGWANDVDDRLGTDECREWTTILSRSAAATALVTLPDLEAFHRWGPHITRFSFALSPLVASGRVPFTLGSPPDRSPS